MFKQPKDVYYLCPVCRLVYKERRIIGTLGVGPSCPKCGMNASNDERVFPRQVRVRCPKPLCGLVQKIAVPIGQDIPWASCLQCGTHLCPQENAYPRLPVRAVRKTASLAWRGTKAVGRGVRLVLTSPLIAARAAGRACAWTALAPFRAVAATGRFLFDLPFAVIERYLRLKGFYSVQETQEAKLSALSEEKRRMENEYLAAIRSFSEAAKKPENFVPQSFSAAHVYSDDLLVGAKTTIRHRDQNVICEVLRHETFYDEVEIDSRSSGPEWRLFQTRGCRPWNQTHFEGDMMLVSDWHLVLLKRAWIEVMPTSNVTDKSARLFLDSTTLEVQIQQYRALLGMLSHFYRREVHAEGILVPGGRSIEARLNGGFGILGKDEKLVLRVSLDGVVLKPLGTAR